MLKPPCGCVGSSVVPEGAADNWPPRVLPGSVLLVTGCGGWVGATTGVRGVFEAICGAVSRRTGVGAGVGVTVGCAAFLAAWLPRRLGLPEAVRGREASPPPRMVNEGVGRPPLVPVEP
jgi:hypothetical protein